MTPKEKQAILEECKSESFRTSYIDGNQTVIDLDNLEQILTAQEGESEDPEIRVLFGLLLDAWLDLPLSVRHWEELEKVNALADKVNNKVENQQPLSTPPDVGSYIVAMGIMHQFYQALDPRYNDPAMHQLRNVFNKWCKDQAHNVRRNNEIHNRMPVLRLGLHRR